MRETESLNYGMTIDPYPYLTLYLKQKDRTNLNHRWLRCLLKPYSGISGSIDDVARLFVNVSMLYSMTMTFASRSCWDMLMSFTIPCHVGDLHINNALADLGASISLMPYTMYEKLGLGEPKPTRMSLELGDRSIQYPRGIVKNVLLKVNKFVLPIDFVILDMLEDSRILIILGRPFMATARAMIDVFNKKIKLRVGDDEVIFDMD
ncbi:DNA-directed DNA polymerase [Tanacetum coccineum]